MLQRPREGAVLVEHVGDAAAHAGGEVAPGAAEHDDAAAGHVLAAVVADALDDRVRARVAHGEALAREAAEERAARGGAVEDGVADDHVLLGGEGRALGRAHGEHAAGEALADVVVRVAAERQLDPGREPGAERLAGRAAQREADRPRRQALGAARLRDALREQAADGAVDVADRDARPRPACRPRSRRVASSISSQSSASASGESCACMRRSGAPSGDVGLREQAGEVDAARLPVVDRLVGLEQVDAADQVVEARGCRAAP